MTLFWLPLAAAGAHDFEEFAWPGGFRAWYREYRPDHPRRYSPVPKQRPVTVQAS
jgi:hypothetical protein